MVEYKTDARFLEVIFRKQIKSGVIDLSSHYGTSGAVVDADSSLLIHPERPVALVLCTNTENRTEILKLRGTVHRILVQSSPVGWHAALAIPRLDAWVMVDPWIKAAFEADERTREGENCYYERSLRIGELTKDRPFDLSLLRRESTEFADLEEFIDRQVRAAQARPKARLF
jgi:hypothetical protein